jgi:hypothetical protein
VVGVYRFWRIVLKFSGHLSEIKKHLLIQNLWYFFLYEKFEDTIGVIRCRKSKKDSEHNDHKKERQSNDQKISKQSSAIMASSVLICRLQSKIGFNVVVVSHHNLKIKLDYICHTTQKTKNR